MEGWARPRAGVGRMLWRRPGEAFEAGLGCTLSPVFKARAGRSQGLLQSQAPGFLKVAGARGGSTSPARHLCRLQARPLTESAAVVWARGPVFAR